MFPQIGGPSTELGRHHKKKPLEEHTVDELRALAAELGIEGRSKMKKDELIAAVRERREQG